MPAGEAPKQPRCKVIGRFPLAAARKHVIRDKSRYHSWRTLFLRRSKRIRQIQPARFVSLYGGSGQTGRWPPASSFRPGRTPENSLSCSQGDTISRPRIRIGTRRRNTNHMEIPTSIEARAFWRKAEHCGTRTSLGEGQTHPRQTECRRPTRRLAADTNKS